MIMANSALQDQDHDGMIDMADLTIALSHAGIDMEKQGVAFLLEGESSRQIVS